MFRDTDLYTRLLSFNFHLIFRVTIALIPIYFNIIAFPYSLVISYANPNPIRRN